MNYQRKFFNKNGRLQHNACKGRKTCIPDPLLLDLSLISGATDIYRSVDKTSKKAVIC